MNAIEIVNLNKSYPGFDLKNINLALPQGSVLGLPGKTALAKAPPSA